MGESTPNAVAAAPASAPNTYATTANGTTAADLSAASAVSTENSAADIDSKLLTKNLALFAERFPELYASCPKELFKPGEALRRCDYRVTKSKAGGFTATAGGVALHSAYNPVREAEKLVQSGFAPQQSAAQTKSAAAQSGLNTSNQAAAQSGLGAQTKVAAQSRLNVQTQAAPQSGLNDRTQAAPQSGFNTPNQAAAQSGLSAQTPSAAPNRDYNAAVFMGFGLGYAPLSFVRDYPQKTLVLIESDLSYLIAALSVVDWTPVFIHASCVFLIGAPTQTIIAVLEKISIQNCCFFRTKSQTAHNGAYFDSIQNLIERNRQKKEINERTLARFSHLWLRNMCKNLSAAATLDGVHRYKNAFTDFSACVIAAGPSLDDALPHLKAIHARCITVCVDTALRACLNAGIEPDFIVSVDPQYWNIRHLDGLCAPKSTLITELASFPPTFRFKCKEIVLCSSLYPLGKFIEQRIGSKGELGAGGSVATTAWDFARMCGCKTVYMVGLDLGFPAHKTHFKGSTFEEKAHQNSNRLHPAETDSYNALYGAHPYPVRDYNGNNVLTDRRLALYAWWFESKCCAFTDTHTKTLSPNGIKIPGIDFEPIERVLSLPVIKSLDEGSLILSPSSPLRAAGPKPNATSAVADTEQKLCTVSLAVHDAEKQLTSIKYNAQKAVQLCRKGLNTNADLTKIGAELSAIDAKILHNDAAELASLVFPGEARLTELLTGIEHPLEKSLVVYNQVIESVTMHLHYLSRVTLTP